MRWIVTLFRNLFRKERTDGLLDEELRAAVDILAREKIQIGIDPKEARRQALIELGGAEQIKEKVREARTGRLIEDIWLDFRYGTRTLRKSPGFTIAAILTLALGIGANTAMFTMVNGLLLRPIPYPNPESLVKIWNHVPAVGYPKLWLADPEFLDYETRNHAFERLAAYTPGSTTLTGRGEPERLTAAWVTKDFFRLLGVAPALGRTFSPEETVRGGPRAVVIGAKLWQRRLGSSPGMIGENLHLGGDTYTVVGLMPPGFAFPEKDTQLWFPLAPNPSGDRGNKSRHVIGRVGRGETIAGAQTDIDRIFAEIRAEHPENYPPESGFRVNVILLQEEFVGDLRLGLLVLQGAVGLILLLACANVASMLLARAMKREKELAIRAALGASRRRLMRQLLAESALLGVLGGTCGLLLATWGINVLVPLVGGNFISGEELSLDWRVYGFTLLSALGAGLLAGVLPARHVGQSDLSDSLKEGTRVSFSGGRHRAFYLIVTGELALALVLLAATGLLLKSFQQLVRVHPGFDTENLITVRLSLPRATYSEAHQAVSFYRELIEHLHRLPGIRSVGAVNARPFGAANPATGLELEGRGPAPGGVPWVADSRMVTPDYFRVMNLPLLRGRLFTEADTPRGTLMAVVSESMAERFWPAEEPLGKRLREWETEDPWLTVVGVVGDVKHRGLSEPARPTLYVHHAQAQAYAPAAALRSMDVLLRLSSASAGVIPALRKEVWDLDGDLPLSNLNTMDQSVRDSVAQPRSHVILLGTFGGLALLLAAVGTYGVMGYVVGQRRHEIGIRRALGASEWDVLRLIVGQGMKMYLASAIVGFPLIIGATQLMKSMLYAVRPYDPPSLLGGAAVMGTVALLACYIPARRATKVDPMVALRYE